MDAGPISATRTATLVGDFDRSPPYAGLADALTLLIGDGRIGLGTRLPSERELTDALASPGPRSPGRTPRCATPGTPRRGRAPAPSPGCPGGAARAHDRALLPRPGDHDAIDLNCAASSAPPRLAAAYAEAVARAAGVPRRPRLLPGRAARSSRPRSPRPTTSAGCRPTPSQIMVTPGALAAAAIVAQALTGPGDRVLVESPVYPNATEALRHCGARLAGSPVDPDGWDLDAVGAALRQTSPRLAYLIPDFQNPTGHADDRRAARGVRRAPAPRRTVAVVDEAHQALAARGPADAAGRSRRSRPDTITIGSASKSFWGGLRLGWMRAPHDQMDAADPRPGRASTSARRCSSSWCCRGSSSRRRHDLDRAPRPAARAARRAGRRTARAPARAGGSGSRPAGWRCGAELPGRPRHRASPPRPSGTASSSPPGRCSPPRAGSTGSSGSRGPAPRRAGGRRRADRRGLGRGRGPAYGGGLGPTSDGGVIRTLRVVVHARARSPSSALALVVLRRTCWAHAREQRRRPFGW